NIADADVEKCLSLLTFLPMDEVRRLSKLEGSAINEAKTILAYECTKLVHGEEEAQKAQLAAAALFGGGAAADVPTFEWTRAQMEEDNRLTTLLNLCGLCVSKGDARKQVQQGAVAIDDGKVADINLVITADMIPTDGILLRKGKKNFCRVVLK
ncbi:MAG: tyrosine--tRNA ligase, partial [Clostridia bacterium]|nr:tyrosine--tRNA ligase [Clostridia bacterium]